MRLGDVQYRQRGEEKIPVSGGPYFAGVIAVSTHSGGGNTTLLPVPERGAVVNSTTDLTDEGYLINNGNSWVMVMSFEADGPVARAATWSATIVAEFDGRLAFSNTCELPTADGHSYWRIWHGTGCFSMAAVVHKKVS